MALLKISSIETLYFDRIYALFGVSLEVEERQIFAVLGPNGAGKTTLLKTVAGLLKDQPKKGVIEFAGHRIERRAPEKIANLGIVYVPEDRGLFRELTVAENLELGLWGRRDNGVKQDLDLVYGMFPILKERAKQEAETLSGGEQQMLALGRAILRRPRLLMLDEPSLGLAPQVAVEPLWAVVAEDADVLPATEAEGEQGGRHLANLDRVLVPRDAVPDAVLLVPERQAVPAPLDLLEEEIRETPRADGFHHQRLRFR